MMSYIEQELSYICKSNPSIFLPHVLCFFKRVFLKFLPTPRLVYSLRKRSHFISFCLAHLPNTIPSSKQVIISLLIWGTPTLLAYICVFAFWVFYIVPEICFSYNGFVALLHFWWNSILPRAQSPNPWVELLCRLRPFWSSSLAYGWFGKFFFIPPLFKKWI